MEIANSKRSFKCPICKRPTRWEDNPYRPFCNKRCSMIDLGNWAGNEYVVESTESPDECGDKEET